MSTGLIGNLYKLHAPIPYIYNTVTSISVMDCKYSFQQIVHTKLCKRTKFCRPGFFWQLFVHILLQNNIHDAFTNGRISWMQQLTLPWRWNITQQWQAAEIFGHSLAHESVFFFCLHFWQITGTTGDATFIHVENSVRWVGEGGGDLCFSNTAQIMRTSELSWVIMH